MEKVSNEERKETEKLGKKCLENNVMAKNNNKQTVAKMN